MVKEARGATGFSSFCEMKHGKRETEGCTRLRGREWRSIAVLAKFRCSIKAAGIAAHRSSSDLVLAIKFNICTAIDCLSTESHIL